MTLGERICALRTARGLSQTELAEALEVSRQSVSKWETDASVPDLDRLVSISGLFHVSLDELVLGTSKAESSEKEAAASTAPVVPPQPHRQTQTAIILFCFAGMVALLGLLLAGAFGLLPAIPFLLCGCIALTPWRHRVLWCVWTVLGLVMFSLPYLTGITWRWGVVLVFLGLLAGTAWHLRKESWSRRIPEKAVVIGCLVCIVGGKLWALLIRPELIENLQISGMLSWGLLVVPAFLHLLLLTVVAVSFSRWLHRRRTQKTL